MDNKLYEMIFKRKSFHLFRNIGNEKITIEELEDIKNWFNKLKPLVDDIKVKIKIVKDTGCHRGQEYCILFYSEKKDNYLQNIGFIGEQLDLYLVNNNIGTLWYGIGKTEEQKYNDLEFVTMMAICKVPEDSFRKDMFKSKRKTIEEMWKGTKYLDIADIARFAPSSCNTQPWMVKEQDSNLEIFRYKNPDKRGIMPIKKVVYQNLIDIGIFLLFISVILLKKDYQFDIDLFDDDENNENELTKIAIIRIENGS